MECVDNCREMVALFTSDCKAHAIPHVISELCQNYAESPPTWSAQNSLMQICNLIHFGSARRCIRIATCVGYLCNSIQSRNTSMLAHLVKQALSCPIISNIFDILPNNYETSEIVQKMA